MYNLYFKGRVIWDHLKKETLAIKIASLVKDLSEVGKKDVYSHLGYKKLDSNGDFVSFEDFLRTYEWNTPEIVKLDLVDVVIDRAPIAGGSVDV